MRKKPTPFIPLNMPRARWRPAPVTPDRAEDVVAALGDVEHEGHEEAVLALLTGDPSLLDALDESQDPAALAIAQGLGWIPSRILVAEMARALSDELGRRLDERRAAEVEAAPDERRSPDPGYGTAAGM